MGLLPRVNTCIAHAERIHRDTGYEGGAFEFGEFFKRRPLFDASPDENLPEGVDAVMRRAGKWVLIRYRPIAYKKRLRFTIAHEVGHALIHRDTELAMRSEARGTAEAREIERQADFFAGELLMPLWAVDLATTHEWRDGRGDPIDFVLEVRRLSHKFRVSEAVSRIQFNAYLHALRARA